MAVDDYGRTIPDVGAKSPEMDASTLAVRNFGNAALSMPLTLAAPDPKLPGALGYIPGAGAVEGFGGMIGSTWQGISDLLNADPTATHMKYGLRIPGSPQFLLDASKHFEENNRQIQEGVDKYTGGVLKAPDVNTTEGQVADILGSGAGGGIGYLPEWLGAGIARYAPYGLKTLSGFVAPTVAHTGRNMAVTTGLATGALGLEAATQPSAAQTAVANTEQTQQPPAIPTIATAAQQPPPIQVADNQVKGTKSLSDTPGFNDVAAPFLGAQPQPTTPVPGIDPAWQKQADAILSGQTTSGDAGPTFGQQGYSGIQTWHVLGTLALTTAGIAAGKAVHGRMAGDLYTAGRDMRYNDPVYAQRANDYNNSVIARGSGEISPPAGQQPIVAPLPGSTVLGKAGTRIASSTVNEAADIQRYLQLSADSPSEGARMAAQFGNMFDTAHMQKKLQYFIATGHDTESGVHITPPKQAYDAFAALDPAQQKLFTDGLYAAGELQKRRQTGGAPHDFPGADDMDLGRHIANGQADPQVAEAIRLYREVKNGMADVGEHMAHQFFTPAAAQAERTTYSDRVPEADLEGRAIHPGIAPVRNPYTGVAQVVHDPVRNLAQHVEELYNQFIYNDGNRMIRDHQLALQARDPNSAQFMTDIQAPTGPHTSYYGTGVKTTYGTARDPVVVVRDRNGVHHMRVDQPDVYRAMTANGSLSARVNLGAANIVRKMFQKGTTGGISAFTGRLYPPVSAFYTSTQMGGYSPPRAYGGRLDRLVQRNLPAGVSRVLSPVARGIDTAGLNQAGAALHYGASRAQHWMGRGADIFAPGATNPINQKIRPILGDHWVDSMHQGMRSRYENSTTHLFESEGMGGVGAPIHMDVPGVKDRLGEPGTGIRLVSGAVSPHAFFNGEWMGAKPFAMNAEKVVGEGISHIADAGHEFWVHLNRDNPNMSRQELIYEARNLVGNAARKGSSKFLRGAESAVPYTNISAQGASRLGRAWAEMPVGAPVAVATGLSVLALTSLLTHMRSQQHMDHMQNELSLQQRESNVALALSKDPTADTMYKLPQEYRAAYAYSLDFWSKMINYVAARYDPASFHAVWDGIQAFLGSHVTNSNADAMLHGAVDLGDAINLPPMLGHVDWFQVLKGKSPIDAYSNIQKYHAPPPGQGTDAPLNTKAGQIFYDLLNNGVGALATALTPLNSAIRYYNEGNSFWDSMGMAGHDWLFGAKGANPQLNVVAEVPMRLSTNPPIVEAARNQLSWFKSLPAKDNPTQLGWTSGRTNLQQVPTTIDKAVSSDPVMRNMLLVAHNYARRIDQAMQPVQMIQQQMASVNKMGMDPERKREWLNQRTRDIANKYQLITSLIGDAQYSLSQLAGKTVTFGPRSNIDWKRDHTQFQ